MTVPGGGFLLPSSRVQGGMVLDETDTCMSGALGNIELRGIRVQSKNVECFNEVRKSSEYELS